MVIDGSRLRALVGADLPASDWLEITQERVDEFAHCTDDPQWIHVDPVRAGQSPFGGTVAHGYLSLALITRFWERTFEVRGVPMTVNYGLDRVRFPAPLPVGSRIRAHFTINDVSDIHAGQLVRTTVTIERENGSRPVCVAETLVCFLSQRPEP